MNLRDLLSELRLNILNDRSDRTDGDSDYLWTDETLIRYINEAQRRFARRSLVLRDGSTPEVVNVTLLTGVSSYTLHPSVLAVMSARLPNDQYDLRRAGHGILNRNVSTDDWDLSNQPALQPGKPLAFSTDEEILFGDNDTSSAVALRLFPAPNLTWNNIVLKLRVVRTPVDDLTLGNLSAVPEIPEDHHLEMLDWAAYLALRIVDNDAGATPRAAEFATSFESHVQAARKQVMMKLFAPKPWGIGRYGWSWEG